MKCGYNHAFKGSRRMSRKVFYGAVTGGESRNVLSKNNHYSTLGMFALLFFYFYRRLM